MLDMGVGQNEQAYYTRLGTALRAIRREAGRSAEEAAATLGVSVESIGRWERGNNAIRAFHLAALAEFYGLSPDAYFDLVDPPELVNPWRGRLSRVEEDAAARFAERAGAVRPAAPKQGGAATSRVRRAPRDSTE